MTSTTSPTTFEQAAYQVACYFPHDGRVRYSPAMLAKSVRLRVAELAGHYFDGRPQFQDHVVVNNIDYLFDTSRQVLKAESAWPGEDGIAAMVSRKQRAYGHDNINAFGEAGIVVRLSDKAARLNNLYDRGTVDPPFESIVDTWSDIAGYAILFEMLRRGWFDLALAEDQNPKVPDLEGRDI